MRFKWCIRVAGTAALALAAHSSLAEVIRFEEFDHRHELAGVGETYTAFGYTFSYAPAPGEPFPTGFFAVAPRWRFNNGSMALTANSDRASITLRRNDGRPFALMAMDLAELNGGGASPIARVEFKATTGSGQLVTHVIDMDNQTGHQRFFFPTTFQDVTVVQWLQGDNANVAPHMFDNVILSTTSP